MTASHSLTHWRWIHKWSSLCCTLFLLLICVTGLPLVFADEIEDMMARQSPQVLHRPGAQPADIDRLAEAARRLHPAEIITSIVVDDGNPEVRVWMASGAAANATRHFLRFDAIGGNILGESDPATARGPLVIQLLRRLHIDLFAGFAGELFMGAMALLFVIAIVSGIVLYLWIAKPRREQKAVVLKGLLGAGPVVEATE